MKLIDVDKLKTELDAWARIIRKPNCYSREDALHIIDTAPEIDAVPVVRGDQLKGYMNGMYEKLLEKLRKNIRMSGWTHIDRLMDEAAEAIEALQQENKRLRAQLDEWKYEAKCHMDEVIAREKQKRFGGLP